jgi:hypothetical protein
VLYAEVVYRGAAIPDRASHQARYFSMSRDFFGALLEQAQARGELMEGLSRDAALLVVDAAINRLQDMLVVPALRPDAAVVGESPVDEETYRRFTDETIALLRRALAR